MVVLIIICANEKDLEMAFGSSDDTVGAVAFATPILGAVLAAASLATNKQVGAFSLFAKTLQNSLFAKGVNFFK